MLWLILTIVIIPAVWSEGHSNMAANCMPGWETHGGSNQCYSVMDPGVRRDFFETMNYCEELGGEILVVRDKETKDFLADKLKTSSTVEGVYLNAIIFQGIWIWIEDNKPVDLDLLPIDHSGAGECAIYTPEGKLKPTDCLVEYNAICQRPAGRCTRGWTPFRDSCYYFSSGDWETNAWAQAESLCEAKGAHLMIIKDPEDDQFIKSTMGANVSDTFWIGLKSVPHDDFYWVDNSVMNYTMMWPRVKEEALKANESECVYYQLVDPPQYIMTWTPTNCLDLRYYICEMKQLSAEYSIDTRFINSVNTPTDNQEGSPGLIEHSVVQPTQN